MPWTDFAIEANEVVPTYVYIIAMVLYGLIFISAISAILSIRRKLKRVKTIPNAINAIYGIYVALIMYAFNGFIIRLSLLLSNGQYALLFLSRAFIYGAGYGVEIVSVYFLSINVLSLSKTNKGRLRLAAIAVAIIAALGTLFTFVTNFITFNLRIEIIITDVFIYAGLLPILAFCLLLFNESTRNANIMGRLRLRLMSIGILFTSIELGSNGLSYIFKLLDLPFYINWHQIVIPILSCVINLCTVMLFYYSLFPPVYLQRAMGILPPSFYEMLKKSQKATTK